MFAGYRAGPCEQYIGIGDRLLSPWTGPLELASQKEALPHADANRSYAALDLGTNNCRLLIARPTRDGFRVIDAFSRIVRLGEGIGASTEQPELSNHAIRRTIRALRVCAAKMRRRDVYRARCVATEACRRAENADEFVARVQREVGLDLEVIGAEEEAALAVSGCSPLLDPEAGMAIIFDIGGGSTELNLVNVSRDTPPELIACESIPCGVVTLSEQFGGDYYDADAYQAMVNEVRQSFANFAEQVRASGADRPGKLQMLGTSGTVTTLTGLHLGLRRYDRSRVDGCRLRFDTIASISERLRKANFDERAAMPCIGPDRADLVVGGCAILSAICEAWPVGTLRVADRGVREGILHTLMRPLPN